MFECVWCEGSEESGVLIGRERQLAVSFPVEQEYVVCRSCGSLSARGPARDMTQHYPSTYYAFTQVSDSAVQRWLRGARAAHALVSRSVLGRLLTMRKGMPADLLALQRLSPQLHERILDVGSGRGRLLYDLSYAGFTALTGCDPFGPDRTERPTLVRQRTCALTGEFDLCMYHHSLEHIDQPALELAAAAKLLSANGQILVRIPLVDSTAFATYGTRWVQLDAPRHRAIPTVRGLELLAARLGLEVVLQWRDSTAFQFWGSELYERDIPLVSGSARLESYFSKSRLLEWGRDAASANATHLGDQGVFLLRRRLPDE